mmetsp:Transcript_18597/g.26182  ORF Transcript_18597/g.26182 Transcript_18597/m.26182 type:complete len:164 (-) Transcript_18597:189-680(-)
MFIASAAADTLQGRAIHKVNERWGEDFRNWNGCETIGIPVCKKKYSPFVLQIKRNDKGEIKMDVVRMYGCSIHSCLRKNLIEKHGERKGWEPFGQWSMRKAKTLARKLTERGNNSQITRDCGKDEGSSSIDMLLLSWKQMIGNGKCMWKIKEKFDDIFSEIHN